MVYSPSTTIVPALDVAFRQIDEEAVVLNLATGTYFGLNAVATRAWTLLAEGVSLGHVQTQLVQEFDVPGDVLERDLVSWLQTLIDKGLAAAR